ncbi:MAG TPA: aminopeptidase [Selenomonadales bacterium]|nr:aminopeptidase [Selenomonadales bacterium]
MDSQMLEKYARLVVKSGVNIQKGQTLVVASPIEGAPFTRLIAEQAYQAGARDVVISWKDEISAKIRFLQAPEEIFDEYPKWQKEFYLSYVREGAAFVSISASDPELLKDVDPGRIMRAQKAGNIALEEYRERLMSNRNPWCVVAVPTPAWARKVFAGLPEAEAVEALWSAIAKAVRVDTADPVAAWAAHKANLKKNMDFLNTAKFRSLHYRNSLGTDLTVELPEDHLWLGGSEYTPEGLEFIANMPTEEVFTLPRKNGVNGTVVSSKPLNYNGNLIDRFSFTVKDGRIVASKAQTGGEILQKLVETDEGSHYLGEVALVPHASPISDSNILFYNTLFDENASCHFAIGKAYPVCLKEGETKSKEELARLGVNDSLVHVDFMVGTADLEITGVTAEGAEIPVFRNGNFALPR